MNTGFEDSLKSKYWKNFKTIFNSSILPQLSEIEKLRKKKIAQFFLICVLPFLLMPLFCFFLVSIDDKVKDATVSFILGCIFLMPICLALIPWFYTLTSKNYASKVKKMIANLFADTFNTSYKTNLDYDYDKYSALLRKSEFTNTSEFIEVDDLYAGNYEDIEYTFSDIRFKYHPPRSTPVTTYSGIVLHIKTSKPFLGHTKIIEKSKFGYDPKRKILSIVLLVIVILIIIPCIKEEPYMPFLFWKINVPYIFGLLFIWIIIEMLITNIKTKLSSIKITDKLIDKNFTFTSTNKDLAKSFINKSFFEKLFELEKIYHTKSIRCAFFENNIIIIIGTPKDLFEFGTLFKSAYDAENYKVYFEEIFPIFQLIYYLKNYSSVSEYLK